ncbi:copper transport protein [Amycolatopsis pretoriensis]|uniref:Copper transport protein n=1 Tax=Amycolatopsis pretoriensis TaxID=218821 RepID=A0A1H5R4Q1_9PSEU|nr:copper resistance protein CopC [Amycolatopsis pretoriensis]SEF33386.1 copper transport protein [Amycolatopsis pretoriensis]
MSGRAARRALALLAFLAGWLVLTAAPASAHVEIVSTTPGDGSRLTAAPAQVSVTLSENVGIQPGSLKVVDTQGTAVDTGPVFQPGDVAEQVAVRLKPGLPDGSYLVEYAFVSTDSHPVRGTFAFVVGAGPLLTSAGAVAAATGTDPVVDVVSTVVRWLSFAGIVLLGGLVFLLTCHPAGRADPRARRLLRAGVWLTAGTAVATFLLQGPYAAGRGLGALLDTGLLADTLRLSYGKLLLVRLVAAAVLAVVLPRVLAAPPASARRGRLENLAMITGFAALLSFSASGHPVTDRVLYFSVAADLVHWGAIAVWAGGLVQLASCLIRRTPDLGPVVTRFSRLAMNCVALIAISGGVLTLRIVPSVSALWTTTYGLLLLGKIAGFAVLLVVANVARRAVLKGMSSGGEGDTAVLTTELRRLRLAVTTEVALASVVLALAAVLTATPPGG